MTPQELVARGGIYFEKIQNGMSEYAWESQYFSPRMADRYIRELWKKNGDEGSYVDCYYPFLEQESKDRILSVLQPQQQEYLKNLEEKGSELMVPLDEEILSIALELIDRYENLLVVQTFSKSRSLAGVRIGYAFGNRTLIKYLNDVKYSFNSYTMNYPSLVIGRAALADRAYFEDTKARIIATRERVKGELSELGFTFGDSQSNFLFITHEKVAARELFEALKIKRIYVRYFNKPRIDNYLRVTIGTEEEMDALIAFLRKYLQEKETEASGENA